MLAELEAEYPCRYSEFIPKAKAPISLIWFDQDIIHIVRTYEFWDDPDVFKSGKRLKALFWDVFSHLNFGQWNSCIDRHLSELLCSYVFRKVPTNQLGKCQMEKEMEREEVKWHNNAHTKYPSLSKEIKA